MKKERQRFRQLVADLIDRSSSIGLDSWFQAEDVEKLCQLLSFEELHELCDAITTTCQPEAVAQLVQQELAKLQQKEAEAEATKEEQKKQAAAFIKVSKRLLRMVG